MKYLAYLLCMSVALFGSTLDELSHYALSHSTVIQKSKAQTDLSELKRKESKVQQYGELNLVGDYTHYNTARTLAPLTPNTLGSGESITTSKDIFYTGVTYAVPLFTGYAQTRQIEISTIAKQMADAKMKLTKEQLVYNVRSLYLSILAQEKILYAQRSYTSALKTLAKQIAYEVELGKKAKIDVLKAQSNLQASQTQVEILKNNIDITKATLSALVGTEIKHLSTVKIKIKKPNYSVNRLYGEVSQLAKVEMEEMSLRKADKTIAKSESSKLPQVNFSTFVGKNYGEDLATNQWDDETLWQAGVNVKWNLVDFGKRDLGVQQAKIAKMEAIFQKEQTLLDLKKLLTQAVAKIKQSYSEYLGNSTQLKLSQKSEKIEEVRYNNDVSTLNDLLLAKGQTQLARAKVIESKYNYQKSKYYLDYLLERGVRDE
jgi:outer membrane protein TolC